MSTGKRTSSDIMGLGELSDKCRRPSLSIAKGVLARSEGADDRMIRRKKRSACASSCSAAPSETRKSWYANAGTR